jgi:peptide/nickel transport system substrate-binding protein
MLKRVMTAVVAGLLVASSGAQAQQPPVAQDRIVIAGGADVTGMNALDVIVIVPDRSLMDHIGDTLLRWEAPGKLGPWLATEWKLVDPVTWELKLRKGVKFHDGEEFNAETVKFFYDTMNDPKTISPSKTNHTFVKEVQIVDSHTVRIITRNPYPVSPNQFALAHMMPPTYVKRVGLDGYRRRPIGTGPYKFVEHVRDTRLTLEAFDGFWGGPQKIKTIVYRPIKEDAARAAALLTGEVDLAMDIPPELIPMLKANPKVQVKQVLSGRTYIILLNALDPKMPTAKREVREAISIAIDREALNKSILQGTGAPAAWLSPKTNGFNPDLPPLPYDPERARKLLAEAGYPNGIDVQFDAPDGKYIKDTEVAEAIVGQMAKAGIRATVRTNDWGLLTKRIFSHQTVPMTLVAWGDANGDPESHNRLALQSGATWSQTKDPHLDDLFARMSREMDPVKRRALLFEQQDYLRKSFPMVYVVQMGIIAGTSAKLDWYQPRLDERYYFFNAAGVN